MVILSGGSSAKQYGAERTPGTAAVSAADRQGPGSADMEDLGLRRCPEVLPGAAQTNPGSRQRPGTPWNGTRGLTPRAQAVATNPLPPLLTGGQKKNSTPEIEVKPWGHLGFQSHFIGPEEGPPEKDSPSTTPEPSAGGVRCGLDWFQATVPIADEVLHPGEGWHADDYPIRRVKDALMDQVLLAASVALGCDPKDWVHLDSGLNGYRQSFLGPGGARVLFDHSQNQDVHVLLPGKACAMVDENAMRSLARYVFAHGGHATRIDIQADDYSRVITPGGVQPALASGDAVTHAKETVLMTKTKVGTTQCTGDTVYLGSAQSRQLLRVYDKNLESGGETNAIRWELQTRKQAAVTLLQQLAQDHWPHVIASRIVAFVDFRDSSQAVNSSDKTRDRARVEWFATLVGMVEKGTVYLAQLPRTVQDLVGWITNQVSTSLAVCFRFWNGDLGPLAEIVAEGERKFRPKHLAMLVRAGQ